MYEAIMQITIYLTAVLFPILLPGIIHVFHVVRDRQQTPRQVRPMRLPQARAFRGLAVPAAA